MNMSHLRYFAAVVEHGNVTRAAEVLYVSQPTVSAALRTLERELGQPLFDRAGRRLRVTSAGAEAYRRVVRILTEWDDAHAWMRTGETQTTLRLGVLDTLPHRWVTELVTLLRREHPRLVTTLRSATAPKLATWLANQRIHAALTSLETAPPGARVVRREPFLAMFHAEHRLARRQKITLRDLSREPFVERTHCEIMASGREKVQQAGVKLNVAARVHSDDLALALVEQGFGYTVAPLSLATDYVRSVPVDDFSIQRSVVLHLGEGAPPDVDRILEHTLDLLQPT